jgi:MFS family permease
MAHALAAAEYTPRERVSVAVSAILGYWMDYYNLAIVAFVINGLQKSLSITLVQAGSLASAALIGSVVGGILCGWVGDRIGRKNALLLSLGIYSIGAVLSAFSWDYASLLVLRFVVGVGVGGEWGAGVVLLNEVWSRDRRGLGTGIVQSMALAGLAAAAIVGAWSSAHFGVDWAWRVSLLLGGAPLVLLIYVRIWMPESRLWQEYQELKKSGNLPPQKAAARGSLIEVFRGTPRRYLILCTLCAAGYFISNLSVSTFAPLLMARYLGASPDTVRNVILFGAASSMFWMIVLGWRSDRIGRRLGVVIPSCIGIVAAGGFYLAGHTKYAGSLGHWPILYGYFFWTMGQTAIAMFGVWFSELFTVEIRSTAVSLSFTFGRGIGAIAPIVVPMLAISLGSLVAGMTLFGACGSALALIIGLLLPETAGRSFMVTEELETEPTGTLAVRTV